LELLIFLGCPPVFLGREKGLRIWRFLKRKELIFHFKFDGRCSVEIGQFLIALQLGYSGGDLVGRLSAG
jgi:hypothetical protein